MNPRFHTFQTPFIIAEIGGNHEGDFEYAQRLLSLAIESGAHAVKFQTYKGDKIVSSVEDPVRNKHFKKFELDDENYIELAKISRDAGIEFMSSVWDEDSLELLDPYINIHKVGSGDLNNYPLLKKIILKNKPMILSTAMSTIEQIRDVVSFLQGVNPELFKKNRFTLMHCVAMYGEPEDRFANLFAIRKLQDVFPHLPIGYSDHSKGTYACELAMGMGASSIEVHFTDDKRREFRDHHLSIDADEMKYLVEKSKQITTLLGDYAKQPVAEIETPQRIKEFRRAVYFKEDQLAGTVITEEMLTTLRPNVGVDASSYFDLIGKKILVNKKALAAIHYDELSKT